jgi:hypothetical protein
MQTKTGIWAWVGTIALSLTASYCGGDDSTTTTTGTSGAGGSSTTTTTTSSSGGSGGSSTTTTTTTTTTGTSGAAGQGGSAGTTGSGGSSPGTGGSTGASCPASPPSGTCTMAGAYCPYGGAYCYCDADVSAGGALKWFCFAGDAGTSANCPAQKPTPGTACPTTELTYCHYAGPSVCVCNGRGGGGNRGWVCY